MKLTIKLFFVFFPLCANAGVTLYKNDFTVMSVEEHTEKSVSLTATLNGGSSDMGESSPADCIIKLGLVKTGKGGLASLLPFSSELMGYTDHEKEIAAFNIGVNQFTLSFLKNVDVCPIGTDFSGDYFLVNKESKEFESSFNELLNNNYSNATKLFHAGKTDMAISLLEPYMSESLANKIYNQNIYNDYGYFLQLVGMHKEAIKYLSVVEKESPNRTVVYLNLADSYWVEGNIQDAKKNYKKYVDMMKRTGKRNNIPPRAVERIK